MFLTRPVSWETAVTKHVAFAIVAVLSTHMICVAGARSGEQYSGVVIFDRWGGCMLYSGIYLMHISEDVKEQLRPAAGKCVQIDATQVEQPMNPGDGLIREFSVLGPAPPGNDWETVNGLTITADSAFEDGHVPEFLIRVENVGEQPVTIDMDSLAPTLLAAKANAKEDHPWSPSDGPSIAVVTRQSFWVGGDGPRMSWEHPTWSWTLTAPRTLEKHVTLAPNAAFELRLRFRLPPGEYEFLAGYGGGVHASQCIASNLIAFDVTDGGTASLSKAADK